ncbi:hypothetical protein ESCO_000142 [Escovopsis weberi]|uniref:Uncharacterized protein n=1 Tax=Escovopsis weberi TaxID=150374 RepID=A0A0M9VTX6_ESCWE|nr:hypothetical protein ESCO_000142 [Escovopsis weberi]
MPATIVSSTVTTSVTTFEFVVGDRPEQLKGGLSKRTRSHLSKQGWKAHFAQHQKQPAVLLNGPANLSGPLEDAQTLTKEQQQQQQQQQQQKQRTADDLSQKKRRKRLQVAVTYELEVDDDGAQTAMVVRSSGALGMALAQGGEMMSAWPLLLSMDRGLGGGRVDPFKSYPGPWRAYFPPLVDHYISHMAVDIPELDQPGNKGLLRTHWFRLVTTDASAFQVVMLLAAANISSVKEGVAAELGFKTLLIKQDALRHINAAFRDAEKRLSDMLIGTVAKMAAYESMHGNVECFRLHMAGLRRMVALRGGLASLGLCGLLRRMIIWIDLNGGYLLGEPRYFPGQTFAGNEEEVVSTNLRHYVADDRIEEQS